MGDTRKEHPASAPHGTRCARSGQTSSRSMPAGLQAGTTASGAALSTLHTSDQVLEDRSVVGKTLMFAGLQSWTTNPGSEAAQCKEPSQQQGVHGSCQGYPLITKRTGQHTKDAAELNRSCRGCSAPEAAHFTLCPSQQQCKRQHAKLQSILQPGCLLIVFWLPNKHGCPGRRPRVHRPCGLALETVLCRQHTSVPSRTHAAVLALPCTSAHLYTSHVRGPQRKRRLWLWS